jgi:AraC family transcriptional regulator
MRDEMNSLHSPETMPLATVLKQLSMEGFFSHRLDGTPGASGVSIVDAPLLSAHHKPSNRQLTSAVSALIDAMNYTLEGDDDRAKQCVWRARALLADPCIDGQERTAPTREANPRACCGGLAPWQIRRLKMHMEINLGNCIRCEDLAQLARLSLSHFMRAFRDSFGCPPHTFLMRRRTERAQGLMLTTGDSLGQIALECGLADQSHLSRLFKKFVGETPAAWRRARLTSAG